MDEQIKHQTDIEKLKVIFPYWLNHNREHLRDQEIWLEKAKKEGLIEIGKELEKIIDHSKKINQHIRNAILRLKNNEALRSEGRPGDREVSGSHGKERPLSNKLHFNIRPIGVIRTP